MGYYSKLVDIWIHQDEASWHSFDFFLLVEAALLVALFQAASMVPWGTSIGLSVAIMGVLISVLWTFVAHRKGDHVLLLEHQARHLEQQIFDGRNGVVERLFPMVFEGSKALFRPERKERGTARALITVVQSSLLFRPKKFPELSEVGPHDLPKGFEPYVQEHHRTEYERAGRGFRAVSSMRVMTSVVPGVFTEVWAFVCGIILGILIIHR